MRAERASGGADCPRSRDVSWTPLAGVSVARLVCGSGLACVMSFVFVRLFSNDLELLLGVILLGTGTVCGFLTALLQAGGMRARPQWRRHPEVVARVVLCGFACSMAACLGAGLLAFALGRWLGAF